MTDTALPAGQPGPDPDDDPYLWLEDVDAEPALAWVRARNAETRARLEAWPPFGAVRDAIRDVLDASDRIPTVGRRGDHLYNFWQDASHPRGLWRRTTLASYRTDQPAWELLLDLDALGREEGVSWTFAGAVALPADPDRVLLMLSRGGADACVVREFDLRTRERVAGGFELPEAKTDIGWIDADTVLVGTDFGPGSLTDAGYARVVKRWRRGTPLSAAEILFEAAATDVAAHAGYDPTPGFERLLVGRSPGFFETELHQVMPDGRVVPLDKPADAALAHWRRWVLLSLRSDWTVAGTTWPAGALLAADAQAHLDGRARWTAVFVPTPTRSLGNWTATRNTLVLDILEDVTGRIEEATPPVESDGDWVIRPVPALGLGTVSCASWHDPMVADDPLADAYAVMRTGFLQPETLSLRHAGREGEEALKARPAQFDASGSRVEQQFATSADGTRVPYFIVHPASGAGAFADGDRPTLLLGYGGFEIAYAPSYSGVMGRAWLARGGVQVVANIRGGGEYGPRWHQAAVRGQRQRAFDDFAAVAEDLLRRGVTQPRRLAIQGGSNGGLLVGAVMLQRPELFGAVVCQVPLLDMRRYHRLLAGASWMSEFGDPDDPADWAFLSRYSPYQNVRAGVSLPPVLFVTSTRDDRVHPGHARKMAARMREQGHTVHYWENIEGGHGGAADNAQRADMQAVAFAFLWTTVGATAADDDRGG